MTMGIPAAFRWLSNKYPKIISPVIENRPVAMEDGTEIPVDITTPNPNGEELDNLYLDMNGIVHPCAHPEDRPAPKDEEEMMLEIFRYTDRVVNMVRPRKILMIAVGMICWCPIQKCFAAMLTLTRWRCATSQDEPTTIETFQIRTRGEREGAG